MKHNGTIAIVLIEPRGVLPEEVHPEHGDIHW